MKSYIEPLNAADALDVLYAHGIPFGDISYSRDNDEDAVLHGPGGDKVLRTPDDVIAALGDDAARALAEHKRFRERAVRELMVPVLSDGESIYNVRTGDTFILDSNCEGKLYGFDYTVTPLATLVDEGEDGIPYGAGVYAIETYGADMAISTTFPTASAPTRLPSIRRSRTTIYPIRSPPSYAPWNARPLNSRPAGTCSTSRDGRSRTARASPLPARGWESISRRSCIPTRQASPTPRDAPRAPARRICRAPVPRTFDGPDHWM